MDEFLSMLLAEVPPAYKDRFVEVVALTDAFCDEHLDDEYRELCRKMATVLCQEESPVLRGKAASWASGIVYAVGRVNFLHDPGHLPHMESHEIATGFGVSMATMHAKWKVLREGLGLFQLHPDWTLPSRAGSNPLIWMLKVNGMLMDIRHAPREAQVVAYEEGLIPYIPADREEADE